MPSLSTLTASPFPKILLLGDSGSGKTGCQAALVKEGYDLFMLDMDNGWEPLANAVRETCPERLDSVQVETFRDEMQSGPTGPVFKGIPRAYVGATKLLDKWGDFGPPANFGLNRVLSLDSLTHFSNAALNYNFGMNPTAGLKGGPDPRTIYGAAQNGIEKIISWLTADWFQCAVIVTAHIQFTEMLDGRLRGLPISAGQALSPKIPTYFNTLLLCKSEPGGARFIYTVGDAMLDLKSPVKLERKYPISTGLATIFKELKCNTPKLPKSPTQPTTPIPSSPVAPPRPIGTPSLKAINKP
jgi:hypothetical protein